MGRPRDSFTSRKMTVDDIATYVKQNTVSQSKATLGSELKNMGGHEGKGVLKPKIPSVYLQIPMKSSNESKVIIDFDGKTHSNENFTPSEMIQEKIDYFISPYNWKKTISTSMNFEEIGSGELKKKWNRLANFIISEDETRFRKSLISINNTLYLALKKDLENRIKRKKFTFACKYGQAAKSADRRKGAKNFKGGDYVNYEGLSSLIVISEDKKRPSINRKQLLEGKSSTSIKNEKVDLNIIKFRNALKEFREHKERKEQSKSKDSEPHEVENPSPRVRPRESIVKEAQRGSRRSAKYMHKLDTYMEKLKNTQRAFLDRIESWNSSCEWSESHDSNSSLLGKLMDGSHPVFRNLKPSKLARFALRHTPLSSDCRDNAKSVKRFSGENVSKFPRLEEYYVNTKERNNFHSIEWTPLSKIKEDINRMRKSSGTPRRSINSPWVKTTKTSCDEGRNLYQATAFNYSHQRVMKLRSDAKSPQIPAVDKSRNNLPLFLRTDQTGLLLKSLIKS